MPNQILHKSIQTLLKKHTFLTHVEIAQQLKKDKAIISGYLEALADLGHISVKKAGNSKVYFINKILRRSR